MSHFVEPFATRVNEILHDVFGGTRFYKKEIIEVPGLLTALLVTHEGIRDDSLELHEHMSWEQFLDRMAHVKPDWKHFNRSIIERLATSPDMMGMGGSEGRTFYFIRGGRYPEQWTVLKAQEALIPLLTGMSAMVPEIIRWEIEHLREIVPVGREHFAEFEHIVRVVFNFLFAGRLGQGRAQVRTEPENEGTEIRDLIFANVAESGFWKDLKDKYAVSEVIVDAKNAETLTRDDLRQLYCYLKPALGFWGFLACRADQPEVIHAFNRTLFKNFSQKRGLLIISEDDLRRMVAIRLRGGEPSDYLRDKMSEFLRSI